MDRKLVVAALIKNIEGAVLLTQRLPEKPMPLFWEFPGGKIEPGESPQVALIREIQEELGISCQVGPIYDVVFYSYESFDVLMLVYQCQIKEAPQKIEVADIAWVLPKDFSHYNILPADRPLLARLDLEREPG